MRGKKILLPGAGLAAALLAGCATVPPTAVEVEERAQVEKVAPIIREKVALPSLGPDSPLEDFILYAVLNNPRVEESFYQWLSALEMVAATRELPDPEVSLEAMITSSINSLAAGFMFMQPGRDKVARRAEAYSETARAGRHVFEQKVLLAAFEVIEITWRYWVLEQKEGYLRERLELFGDLADLALARVRTGQDPPARVLRLQMERDRFETALDDLADSRDALRIHFQAALGIGPGEEAPAPPKNPPVAAADFSEEEIWARIEENNPRLALARTRVNRAEILVRQAYREASPDFGLGLVRNFFAEMSLTRPMLTLSLPRRRRVAALAAAAEAGRDAAGSARLAEEQELFVMLADASLRRRRADREATLYEERLLPRTRAVREETLAGYISGARGFAEFLEQERQLLDYSFFYLSAVALGEIARREIALMAAGVNFAEDRIAIEY